MKNLKEENKQTLCRERCPHHSTIGVQTVEKNTGRCEHRPLHQQGITLIALIITIIIMLILVTVSITLSINGGLFEKAGETVKNQSTKQVEENGLSESATSYIEQKTAIATGETYLIGETTELPVGWSDTSVSKTLVEICEGKTCYAPIPEGFVLSEATGEGRISEGLVIYEGTEPVTDENVEIAQTTRNQFVWIPVTITEEDTSSSVASFAFAMLEPDTSGYASEVSDYNAMLSSVYLYKGFYMGRYETGTEQKRTSSSGITDVKVQRDKYPYNYVAWGTSITNIGSNGAVYLSQTAYPDTSKYTSLTNNTGVISTLTYGGQYGSYFDFINISEDVTNFGNYKNSAFTTRNTSAVFYSNAWHEGTCEKESGTTVILTAGANENFKIKNVFDIGGNLYEWSMFSDTNKRGLTGGVSLGDGEPRSNDWYGKGRC